MGYRPNLTPYPRQYILLGLLGADPDKVKRRVSLGTGSSSRVGRTPKPQMNIPQIIMFNDTSVSATGTIIIELMARKTYDPLCVFYEV